MKKYTNKINKRELYSSDIDSLISDIETIMKEKKKGHTELSDDDIKQLKAIRFLLSKYEEGNESTSLVTRQEYLSHHKVKNIINDLELNNIITYVSHGIGGQFSFTITDMVSYRNFLYKLIEEILNKIPKGIPLIEKIRHFNWKDNLRNIILGVFITVVGGVIAGLLLSRLLEEQPEPPRIEIKSASFQPTSFQCSQTSEFDMKYKVAHIGGTDVGFGQPYYVFVNQTKNTCLRNFTFFNSSLDVHLLCYNTFYKGKDVVEACDPEFDPIHKETVTIESHQSSLPNRMIEIFKGSNLTSCELTENIKLCVKLDGNGYCSMPNEVEIKYSCNI